MTVGKGSVAVGKDTAFVEVGKITLVEVGKPIFVEVGKTSALVAGREPAAVRAPRSDRERPGEQNSQQEQCKDDDPAQPLFAL